MRPGRRWVSRACALLLVARAGGGRALAAPSENDDIENVSLETLLTAPADVWIATKTEQKNHEAPALVTILTREQIAVWGYRSVAEALGHLLGFYVVDDHTLANVAVRGISGGLHADSSIVKVLIDGHAVAFHATGGNWLGPELVPLSAVERIEVVRGPASALFGADAFLGVINIKTRSGKSLGGANAWLSAGRAGGRPTTDVDVSAGFERGDLDVMVAARRNDQDLSGLALPASSPAPSLPLDKRDHRVADGVQGSSTSVITRLTYRPRASTTLGAFGYFSALDRAAPFASLVQLADNREVQSQLRTGLIWEQQLDATRRLTVQGSAFSGRAGAGNRLEVGSDFYYVRRAFGFRGADLDAQLEWVPEWGQPAELRLVGGLSGLVDDEQLPSRIGVIKQSTDELQAGQELEPVSIRQGRKTFVNAGAYLQLMAAPLSDWLKTTGGLRYDWHNVYGGQISERVGLVANPMDRLHAKLLYGSAFKAPSPLLLYAVPSSVGDVVGNPELEPQYVKTAELQLSCEPLDVLELSSNVAYSILTNKTEFVQQEINKVARNVARAQTLSWESQAELKIQSLFRAHLGLELQRTVRRTGQEDYPAEVVGTPGGIYPNFILRAGAATQPTHSPVRLTVQASYVGARRASDTNILLNRGPYQLPAYLLLEAGLATIPIRLPHLIHQEVSFALHGKNLLGATGPAPGFSGVDYPLAPRTLLLQMNLSL